MNLFEILKARHGMITSDLKTMLWRNNANPSEYDVTITNTPPLYLPYSLGYNLSDWSITGNTVQDGTPTPENPVDVKGVGEKTGNLCSELVVGGINSSNGAFISSTSGKRTGHIKINSSKSYTIRSNHYPFQNFVCFYGADKNYLSRTTGIGLNGERSFTTPDNAEYMAVTCTKSNESQINPNDYDDFYLMINSGTAALPYEPYGYKIPVVTRGTDGAETTTNIYLDSPLMTGETASSDGTVRRADGTIETITPPNIPTTTGTCVLDVDTSVQPSSVTVTYKSSVPDNDMQGMISLLAEI